MSCATVIFAAAGGANAHELDAPRLVSVGGAVTEIIYALGAEDMLIARDTTSSFPEPATELPDVGYMRALSPEGLLSVRPDLILAEEGSGPPEMIEVMKAAEIGFVIIPNGLDSGGVVQKILAVGEALHKEAEAEALAQSVGEDLERIAKVAAGIPLEDRKKVLFILSTQGGRIMAAGANSSASAIIEMAGGVNAISSFEGYKPVTDEALLAAAPDIILMMDRGGDHALSDEKLFAMPALSLTPAAANQQVIRMDGLYLLGFGPRTAQAATELSHALYGPEK
ncbi:hemin ABC transporter substrate-binding protein [Falsihalocynthiibacter arcticus]|uniref:Hemin ABC transporter substrate-binding protein n=1 Tax=Falsihalocynthiibacter arcticus TaxID=1579316 RepID=A0A126V7F0_9RHOB|nr:hemin ABC transporter substrate-binding protein [Falsihalocynthiibacter arcticus]